MQKIIILFIAAVAIVSCGRERSPVDEALQKKVLEENPGLASFAVEDVRTEVAVRLTDELSRRENLYRSQVSYREEKVKEFRKKGMLNNLTKQKQELQHAGAILDDLQQYREIYADRMDSVIYYVVSFTGSGAAKDNRRVERQEMRAAVGPDCRVFRIATADDNIYRGMGVAIPAYEYILAKNKAAGQENIR